MKTSCFQSFLKGVQVLVLPFVFLACGNSQTDTSQALSGDALVAKGKSVYQSSCIVCHNMDPKKDGNVGPAVYGSSLELLTKRIMEAKYPSGYKPKRSTSLMQAMPYLKKDIEAIHVYLNK